MVAEPVVVLEPLPTPNEEEVLARRNRRRGFCVAASPGVVAGIVVAVVCIVLIGPVVGAVAGVVVAVGVAFGTWWGAAPLLLRALHVEPADEDEHARVFNQVEGLCASMGLVVPTVYVVDDPSRGALVARASTARRRTGGDVGTGRRPRPRAARGRAGP